MDLVAGKTYMVFCKSSGSAFPERLAINFTYGPIRKPTGGRELWNTSARERTQEKGYSANYTVNFFGRQSYAFVW